MTISVIDYGAGNLKSITNILQSIGYDYKIIDNHNDILKADKIILPGVGHFGQLIDSLTTKQMIEPLKTFIAQGKPYLGICLGMQILFESSEEAPEKKGLSIFKGKVLKFTDGKVPQIGWNCLQLEKESSYLTEDYVYFVNSYYLKSEDKDIIASTTNYFVNFVSAIEKDNLLAVQFHPEKSGKAGYHMVKRWVDHAN